MKDRRGSDPWIEFERDPNSGALVLSTLGPSTRTRLPPRPREHTHDADEIRAERDL